MTDAQTDRMLEAHKFSQDGSIWAPETLQQVRDRLERIDEYPCHCGTSEHTDALHDLANDDVPVLLKVIERQATEVERLQAARRDESRYLVETHNDRADLLGEVERLRATVERVRELAHNPETYSGTGVVTVTPRRILAALDADR